VNGVINGQSQISVYQSMVISNAFPLLIGKISSGQNFGGLIDDVRLYNRALSTNEAQTLFLYESGAMQNVSGIAQAMRLTFPNLLMGGSYQVQTSGDLTTWTNYGTPFIATSTNMVQYADAPASHGFFRLLPVQ